jgi:hypothetical protein
MTLSCSVMRPPCCSFHFQTRLTNSSRPRSWRDLCSVRSSMRSTTIWVAMPAWSVPGSQSALYPAMRRHRIRMSWMAMVRACPMWSEPVTFGGGMTIVYGARGALSSAWK